MPSTVHVGDKPNDTNDNVSEGYGFCGYILIGLSYLLFLLLFPLAIFQCIKVNKNY